METVLDKKKLLDFMTSRFNKLNDQAVKDFTGDMQPRIHELREVKYWKEAIERGEFDDGLQEIYLILSHTEPQIVDYTFYKDVEIVRERVARLNHNLPKQEYWFITLYENARKKEDNKDGCTYEIQTEEQNKKNG